MHIPSEQNTGIGTKILQLVTSLDNKLAVRSIAAASKVILEKLGQPFVYAPIGREISYLKRWGGKILSEKIKTKNITNSKALITELTHLIQEHQIKIIHAHDYEALKISELLGDKLDVKIIYSLYKNSSKNSFLGFLNNAMFKKSSHISDTIVPSKYTYNKLLTKYARRNINLSFVPIPVDFSVFSENKISQERTISLANSWGMLEKPRFLILAKPYFSSKKWQEQIIKLSFICQKFPEKAKPYIVILADDYDKKGLYDFQKKFYENQNDVLCLMEPIGDVEAALKLSSIYLDLPPEIPFYSLDTLNALAMGNAVVSWKNQISISILPQELQKLLVEKDNLNLISDNLKELLSMSEHQRDFTGRTCRNFVLNNFNTHNIEELLIDAYSGLSFKKAG